MVSKTCKNSIKILIVDDDNDILNLLDNWLNKESYIVERSLSAKKALLMMDKFNPNIVITDLYMQEMDGMELLRTLHSVDPLLPVIMLSGKAQIPDVVNAMHLGISEFLTKPIERHEFIAAIERVVPFSLGQSSVNIFFKNIIYKSKKMLDIIKMASLVADKDVSIFISGATGTGKEEIAKSIHKASSRCKYPFIAINCGAIPEQLLESELFGHEKGAFTGANIKHNGLFQAADGGTIFLDEIGDMPIALQVKLLRVLQDFEVRPVGSSKTHKVNVRLISATHRELEEEVRRGNFREDLFYRLKVVPLNLPTLAERTEDIPLLADHILEKFSKKNKNIKKKFSPDAMEYLMSMPWPGNIRQLINAIELCDALSKSITISLSLVKKTVHNNSPSIQTLKVARKTFDINYLSSLMRVTNGNVASAAKIAGRNRTEFYNLLNQYDIKPASFRNI